MLGGIVLACNSTKVNDNRKPDAGANDASVGGSGGSSGSAGTGASGGTAGVAGAGASGGAAGSAGASGSGGAAGSGGVAGSSGSAGSAGAAGSGGAAGAGGAVDAGPCPNGVQGGDGTVHYPRWPIPAADSRATSEFSTTTETALDHATCLMWQRNTDATVSDWTTAKAYCDKLVLDGFNDWRLPTRAELTSLTDFTAYLPAINTTVFPGTGGGVTSSGRYWSGTIDAVNADRRWVVIHGSVGQMTYIDGAGDANVRCVRGKGAPLAVRFDSSVAGVVTDNETGLTWEASPPDADYDTAQATAYCAALQLAGYTDWRLPALRELATLTDPTLKIPALPSIFSTPGTWYWASTLVYNSTEHWAVQFNTGFSAPETPPGTVYANTRMRCVR